MSGPNKVLFDDGSKSVTHVLTDRRPFRCLVLYSNSKLLVSMGGDGLSGQGGTTPLQRDEAAPDHHWP